MTLREALIAFRNILIIGTAFVILFSVEEYIRYLH